MTPRLLGRTIRVEDVPYSIRLRSGTFHDVGHVPTLPSLNLPLEVGETVAEDQDNTSAPCASAGYRPRSSDSRRHILLLRFMLQLCGAVSVVWGTAHRT